METLRDIADELYALAPNEFIEVRNARAARSAAAGDRDRAARIRSFVKPPVAAWAVNALARNRPEEVDDLMELGRRLREASTTLDRDALQQLGRERQRMLAAIGRSARELGAQLAVTVSEPAVILVQQTFQAALADPDAAEAVRSGMLTRPLASSGVDPVDLAGAVALPLRLTPGGDGGDGGDGGGRARSGNSVEPVRGPRAVTQADAEKAAAERAAAREAARAEAKREAEQARQAAEDAANDVAELDLRLRDATERHDELVARVRELRDALEESHDELSEVTVQAAALRKERGRAQRASDSAARAAARARHRTDG